MQNTEEIPFVSEYQALVRAVKRCPEDEQLAVATTLSAQLIRDFTENSPELIGAITSMLFLVLRSLEEGADQQ